ncbi:phenoloxidase-activating factor 2 [Caerostris darwini]|uniref:Phenoloxidase-activating factor 2 n=1 Tax=Caerostris darwini TaxID=1538125 RepID=A0AAV4RJ46_9ARAC|nr:phenoloxidase-activating factor 2 [Caerostris darwini]
MVNMESKGIQKMPFHFFKYAIVVFHFLHLIHSQNEGNHFQCECIEYWECIGQGGTPYSYCDYSDKVCCFVNAEEDLQVGILPRKGKLASCGQKGADSGKDGVSEAGEWSWHDTKSKTTTPIKVFPNAIKDLDPYKDHDLYQSLPNSCQRPRLPSISIKGKDTHQNLVFLLFPAVT